MRRSGAWTIGILLCATWSAAHGQSVLIYDGSVNGYAVTAASNLGYAVTVTTDDVTFSTELFGGTAWDLVVVDNPTVGDDSAALLGSFISDDDGQAILAFADLDTSDPPSELLRFAFQIAEAIDYSTPLDISSWDLVHPMWTTPNVLPSPIVWDNDAPGEDGDRLTGFGGTETIAGFVGSPALGEGAIVIGNFGRTICNGFVFDRYSSGIVDLIENQMVALLGPPVVPLEDDFVRGDANQDGTFDIADAVATLAFLFVPGTPPPDCFDAADSNDDGTNDISDGIYTLSALFVIGSPGPLPPNTCGADPTADGLSCETYVGCP